MIIFCHQKTGVFIRELLNSFGLKTLIILPPWCSTRLVSVLQNLDDFAAKVELFFHFPKRSQQLTKKI
jgi:hypothetical protein